MSHLEQRGSALSGGAGPLTSRRDCIGLVAFLVGASAFASPAIGQGEVSFKVGDKEGGEGSPIFLRETLRLIDEGELGAAEERLTGSIKAWKVRASHTSSIPLSQFLSPDDGIFLRDMD